MGGACLREFIFPVRGRRGGGLGETPLRCPRLSDGEEDRTTALGGRGTCAVSSKLGGGKDLKYRRGKETEPMKKKDVLPNLNKSFVKKGKVPGPTPSPGGKNGHSPRS